MTLETDRPPTTALLRANGDDFFENAPVPLVCVGPDGSVLRANRVVLHLLGYHRDEMTGRRLADFHADPGVVDELLARLRAGETLHAQPVRLRTKDDSILDVTLDANALRERGEFIHARVAIRDVTQSGRAFERARASEDKYRTLAESLPLIVCLADAAGRPYYINSFFHTYTGLAADQVSERAVHALIHPEDLSPLLDSWRHALETGEGYRLEFRLKDASGAFRRHRCRVLPINGETGAVSGWMAVSADIEDIRRAEDDLRRSETLYRTLAESAPALVVVARRDSGLEFANRRFLDYVGATADDLARRDWMSLIHPDDAPPIVAFWENSRRDEPPAEGEFRLKRADGEYRWHLGRVAPIEFEGDAAVAWIGAAVDIHDRKLADQRLSESEQRYRSLFAGTPLPVWVVDRATLRVIDVNERAARDYGYTRDEFLRLTVFDLHPPEDRARLTDAIEAVRDEPHYSATWRHRKKDGSIIDVEVTTQLITYEGRAARAVVVHDITERHAAEVALAESERRYRVLAESSPLLVWTVRPGGNVEYFNQRWLDYTGMTPDEAYGHGWENTLHPEDLAKFIERRRTQSGGPFNIEGRLRRHDGVYRWHMAQLSPLGPDEAGLWLGTAIDIDDRKRAEEEREKLLDDLRAALAAKDEFLGLVSHELRTPITTILGNADVLRRAGDRLDEAARGQALADVAEEAERLSRIIENLLALARLENGQQVDTEPVLLPRLVQRVVRAEQLKHPRRRIDMDLATNLPPVQGDGLAIDQILRNLLSNAEKYSPADAAIELRAERHGDEVWVSIADRGRGIPPDELEHIFTPFYRSPRTAHEASGAGIGLAVCLRLTEAQGGRIWAEQRPGGGTRFTFSLPVVQADGE